MLIERSQHLGAAPYQRNSLRNGHSNGFKNRSIESRVGNIDLCVAQVRNSDILFYSNTLERRQRSEKALSIAIAEMYLQGVSTRRVTHILEALCGLEVI